MKRCQIKIFALHQAGIYNCMLYGYGIKRNSRARTLFVARHLLFMKYKTRLQCAAALRNHYKNLSLQARTLAYSNHSTGSNEDMNYVLPNWREKFLALVEQTSIIFQDAVSNAKCLNTLRLFRINWLKSSVMKVYLPNRLKLIAMQINICRDKFLSPSSLCCFQDVTDKILHLQLCVGAVRVI